MVVQELRMSVLDQAPVAEGGTAAQALRNSVNLAQHAERLGYRRFWMSEHHAMATLACTAPEVVLARVGAATERIRLGSGGVMLPHYAALKVAEQFRTLEAMFPGRVDLGVGRAPGGGPVESLALRRERRVHPVDDSADQLSELLAFLGEGEGFPAAHPFSKIRVTPEVETGGPDVWMLGSSLWDARAAAEFGLPYAFAHFFSPLPTREAIELYQRNFQPRLRRERPEAMVAVGVTCAETAEEAEFLAASVWLLQARIRLGDRRPIEEPGRAQAELRAMGMPAMEEGEWPRVFVGTPERVASGVSAMADALGISEVVVNTICWDHEARRRSYALLAGTLRLREMAGELTAGAAR